MPTNPGTPRRTPSSPGGNPPDRSIIVFLSLYQGALPKTWSSALGHELGKENGERLTFLCLLVIFTCLSSHDSFLQMALPLAPLFLPFPPYPGGSTNLLSHPPHPAPTVMPQVSFPSAWLPQSWNQSHQGQYLVPFPLLEPGP